MVSKADVDSASSKRRPSRRLGLGLFSVFSLTVLGALLWLDRELKTGQALGYIPPDTRQVVAFADFPSVIANVTSSDQFTRLDQETVASLRAWESGLRRRLGIRPTPGRWRLWLGETCVAARTNHGPGFVVRPGVLMRVATWAHETFAFPSSIEKPQTGVKVFCYAGLYYGWKDGYLAVSESPDYIEAVQNSPEAYSPPFERNDLAVAESRTQPNWRVAVSDGPGLPVRGVVDLTLKGVDGPLTLGGAWSGQPMMLAAGIAPDEIRAAVDYTIGLLPYHEFWDRLLSITVEALPHERFEELDEYLLVVTDVMTAHTLPIPNVAFTGRGVRLAALEPPPSGAIPYEWGSASGWIEPFLGEDLSFSVAAQGRDRLLTNSEPVMAQAVESIGSGQPVSADARLVLRWDKTAAAASSLLLWAAEYELIPRRNAEDLKSDILPMFEILGELGVLRLDGQVRDDGLRIEGTLAAADMEGNSRAL